MISHWHFSVPASSLDGPLPSAICIINDKPTAVQIVNQPRLTRVPRLNKISEGEIEASIFGSSHRDATLSAVQRGSLATVMAS